MAQANWLQKQLVELFKKSSRDKRELHELFSLLLTQKEYEELARRFEIIKALDFGMESQRTISERLHVSIATVTKWSNEFNRNKDKLKKFVTKLK